jgi:hypothetical protein
MLVSFGIVIALCAHMLMVAETVNPRMTVTFTFAATKAAWVAVIVTCCGTPGGLER